VVTDTQAGLSLISPTVEKKSHDLNRQQQRSKDEGSAQERIKEHAKFPQIVKNIARDQKNNPKADIDDDYQILKEARH
jgi:hypothetical protein